LAQQWSARVDAPASDMEGLHPDTEPSPRLPQVMALDLTVTLSVKAEVDPAHDVALHPLQPFQYHKLAVLSCASAEPDIVVLSDLGWDRVHDAIVAFRVMTRPPCAAFVRLSSCGCLVVSLSCLHGVLCVSVL